MKEMMIRLVLPDQAARLSDGAERMNVLSEADAVGSDHSSSSSEDGKQWLDSLLDCSAWWLHRTLHQL